MHESSYRGKGRNAPDHAAISAHSPIAAQFDERIEHLDIKACHADCKDYSNPTRQVCPDLLNNVLGLRAIDATCTRVVEYVFATAIACTSLR